MTNPLPSKQSRKPAFLPGFVVIAAKLTAAGLPIPVPLPARRRAGSRAARPRHP